MKKNYYLVLIIVNLIFTTCLFSEEIIDSKLRYLESGQSIWNLDKNDFDMQLEQNNTANLETNNLIIYIGFENNFKYDFLELYINDKKIPNLFDMGDMTRNRLIIDIQDFLVEGKNTIDVFFNDMEHSRKDEKKWFFNISAVTQKGLSLPFQLTSSDGQKKRFSISPDGQLIAYVSEGEENAIKLLSLENREEIPIISSKVSQKKFGKQTKEKRFYSSNPCWSRDSNFLFFISSKTGYPELYRAEISLDGNVNDITILTNFQSYITTPVFSPIEDKMFFASNKDGNMRIFMTSKVEEVRNQAEFEKNTVPLTNEDISAFSPDISFDGSYLAYCVENQKAERH